MDGVIYTQHPSGVFVSESGVIFDESTNTRVRLRTPKNPNSYLSFSYRGRKYDVHRVVAETYVDKPEEGIAYIVNHKDGNKRNNHRDNLEWVTYSRNLLHAYETGLRTGTQRVVVVDLVTEETMTFDSIGQTAKYFNVNTGTIHSRLKWQNRAKIWKGRYLLVPEGEPIPTVDRYVLNVVRNGECKMVLGSRIGRNGVFLFESMSAAAEHIGRSVALFSKRFKNALIEGRRGFDFGEWTFSLVDGEAAKALADFNIVSKVRGNRFPIRKPTPVRVKDLDTGETAVYDSIQELSDKLQVSKASLQKQVHKNGGVWNKRLKVEYLAL